MQASGKVATKSRSFFVAANVSSVAFAWFEPIYAGILRVQRIVGSILYYARALDAPLLPALTEIVSNQEKATDKL